HTWTVPLLGTGLEKGNCRVVVDRIGMQRPDDAKVVYNVCHMWEYRTDPSTTLSILGKVIVGSHQWKTRLSRCHAREPLPAAYRFEKILSHHLSEFRFRIKRLQLRHATTLEQINHTLCLGCKMGQSPSHPIVICAPAGKQIRYQ